MERSSSTSESESSLANDLELEVDIATVNVSSGDIPTAATSVESLLHSITDKDESTFQKPDIHVTNSPACESPEESESKEEEIKSSDSVSTTPKKVKPRVLKVKQDGIFTIKTLESTNILAEWVKALRVSIPYILRLVKIFWKLSPPRVSLLVTANLLKSIMPSLKVWIIKQFLDHVQRAAGGEAAQWRKMIVLVILGAGVRLTTQGLDVLSYNLSETFLISRDKILGVMQTRFSRELGSMLIGSYVNLDCDQINSSKVKSLFNRVYHLKTTLISG